MDSNPMAAFSKTVGVLISQTRLIAICLPDDLRQQLQFEIQDLISNVDRWEQRGESESITFGEFIALIETMAGMQRKCIDLIALHAERVPNFDKSRIEPIRETIAHLEQIPRLLELELVNCCKSK